VVLIVISPEIQSPMIAVRCVDIEKRTLIQLRVLQQRWLRRSGGIQ